MRSFHLLPRIEEWHLLEEIVQSQPVPGFGKKLTSILGIYLSEYDTEVTYFDEGVRYSKRKQLEEKLLQLVQPAYHSMLGHIRSGTLDRFKEAFDTALKGGKGFVVAARDCNEHLMSQFDEATTVRHISVFLNKGPLHASRRLVSEEFNNADIGQANWDSSKVKEKLRHDIDGHIASVRAAKLSELTTMYESSKEDVGHCYVGKQHEDVSRKPTKEHRDITLS